VEETAPSREASQIEQRNAEESASTPPTGFVTATATAPGAGPARRLVAPTASAAASARAGLSEDVDRDILIVASKLKKYIRDRSGLRTSDGVLSLLSDLVRAACDEAIGRARESERTTVLDRDVPRGWRPD